jgi:hypothetical protein
MKSIFFLIITVFFISSLFTAQPSLAEETLDFENCNGVLSIDEVKNVIGDIDDITVDSRGVIPVDGPSVNSGCASTFESSGGTISMSLLVMNSVDDAVALYKENLDSFSGQDFEIREYLTFWNNFDVVLNDQGVGSFMVSQYDKFFLNIRSNRDEGDKALADVEQLRVLATIVQKKILDLDDVPISPPNPIPNLDDHDRFTPEDGLPPIATGKVLSPKKQVSQGIDPVAVKCNEGLVLIIKNNGSPACVRQDTAVNLEQRSWGDMAPPCCKPTEVSSATNFEECVNEGNPIMESYPRKCRTIDGKQFVESIPENKKCEMSGGLWGIWSNHSSEKDSCNPSTSDVGMECNDSSQCQSFCQAKEGSKISNKETGTCYGHELAICMQEVANGIVQPEWCQ